MKNNVKVVCRPCGEEAALSAPKGYIKVALLAADGRESVWAAPTKTKGVYRIDNVPAFVFGYSFGDLIRVKKDRDGLYIVAKIVKRGGEETLGVLVNEGGKTEKAVVNFLKKTGCLFEGSGCGYYGVSVPLMKGRGRYVSFVLGILARNHNIRLEHLSHDEGDFDGWLNEVERRKPGITAKELAQFPPVEPMKDFDEFKAEQKAKDNTGAAA